MAWVEYYQRERAASIDAANDRTDGMRAYCEHRMNLMLTELSRRKLLAHRFRKDPLGPRWSTAGGRERNDMVEFAQELKARWPIDRFLTELMLCDLRPSRHNQWTGRCVSPAHRDSQPSMVVYGGDDPHVHCYGCGVHGDVIDLTAMYFGLTSFPDVVRKLAEVSGPISGGLAS